MNAVVIVSYDVAHTNLVGFLNFKNIQISAIDDSKHDVVIHHNIGAQISSIFSVLKLYDYNISVLIVQDNNKQWLNDYSNINTQLKLNSIRSVVIDISQIDNTKFIESVVSKLLDVKSKILKIQHSDIDDTNDIKSQKHGRLMHEGSIVGQYVQSPPMLFTRDGHSAWLGDTYRGRSAFLILGGPSFANIDQNKLLKPGVLTMGVNNSVKTFRPNLWVSVDTPNHFMKSIWLDPKITKFVPYSHVNKLIFDNENWIETTTTVGDCPNVWYYKRNEKFNANQFLFEDTFNWGNHKQHGGGRSVMLVAIRMLFHLGIRNVYLLGCDFDMNNDNKYHFEQDRSESSIRGNTGTYKLLIERFSELKPIFNKYGFNIYNCNENSNLKVFPFIQFDQAIKYATFDLPRDIKNERSQGLYDRLTKIKAAKQEDKNDKHQK